MNENNIINGNGNDAINGLDETTYNVSDDNYYSIDYDAFLVNENVINSVIRLRTLLDFNSINAQLPVNREPRRVSYSRFHYNTNRDMVTEIQDILTGFINTFDNDYETLESLEDVKVTLSENEFNNLDHLQITLDCNTTPCVLSGDCHICLDSFKKDDIKTTLQCKHFFHKECIYKWLCIEKTNCPICRYDVREKFSKN